jgi:hypothetical protein
MRWRQSRVVKRWWLLKLLVGILSEQSFLFIYRNTCFWINKPANRNTLEKCSGNKKKIEIFLHILIFFSSVSVKKNKTILKLKLIKIYLKFSRSQKRNNLTTLSIEKDMLKNIDIVVIISNFASHNARRSYFLWIFE